MVLTLIGMSGAGKSTWAARLAERGFARLDCDSQIAARLAERAGLVGTSLEAVGRWMGFPDEQGFAEREAAYLACEEEVMREALALAEGGARDLVVDTSGSAIYLGEELWCALRAASTVAYLALPPDRHPELVESYLAAPRPVVWNGLFERAPGEGRRAAFARCYAELVRQREVLYRRYQDITLHADVYRDPQLTAEGFLAAVGAAR